MLDVSAAVEQVRPLVEAVRDRGESAVREATERFDGVSLGDLRVPAEALRQALEELDPAVRAALEEAVRRARTVSQAQLRADEVVRVVDGATVTERCFEYLEHAPVRVTGFDIPYPPAKSERHHQPDLDRILDGVDRVLGRPNSLSGVEFSGVEFSTVQGDGVEANGGGDEYRA